MNVFFWEMKRIKKINCSVFSSQAYRGVWIWMVEAAATLSQRVSTGSALFTVNQLINQ